MRRWRTRLAFLAVLGVPLLLVVGWNWYTREATAWDYTGLPDRIHYCDRDYLAGAHVTRAQIDREPNQFGRFAVQQVGKTAAAGAVLARPMPDSERRAHGSVVLPCTMAVYLKVGADDYIAYGLSGGP